MEKVVPTSESHYENVLFGGSRQLPSQLAARSTTVDFENSSDVHIGPRHQNTTPVTVNQYVTVVNDIYDYPDITPQPPERANPVGKYT
jgi:hypothetical protein